MDESKSRIKARSTLGLGENIDAKNNSRRGYFVFWT